MSDYDTWLTTDPNVERGDMIANLWEEYCEEMKIDTGLADPDHPGHHIYLAWENRLEY